MSKFSDGTNTGYIAPQAHFVSTSLANVSAKTTMNVDSVVFTNTSLVSGVTVWVKFAYPNLVYNATLQIGTSTAKSIKGDPYWNAGEVVSFTYDGTNWCRNGETIPYFTGTLNVSFDNIRTGVSDYGVITLDNSYTVLNVFQIIRNSKKPCYLSVTNGTDRCVLLSEGYMQENGLDDWISAIITFRSVSRRLDSDSDTTGYFEAILPNGGQFKLYYRKNVIYGSSTSSTTNALAKFKNTNGEIIPGPTLGSSTTTFLRNDGTWEAPPGTYTHPTYTEAAAAAVKVGRDGTGHVVLGDALTYTDVGAAESTHVHGNVTNDGKIGSTANYAVYTTTGGALTASAALPTTTTNATIAALPVWSAAPTDSTYFIRQDTGGSNSFGRVPFSTVNTYIKSKNPALNYITYDSTEDAIKFVFPS